MRLVLVEGAERETEQVRRALSGHSVHLAADVDRGVASCTHHAAQLLLVVWPATPGGPAAILHPLLRDLPCPLLVLLAAEQVVERRALTAAGIRYLPFPVDREELAAHLHVLGSGEGEGRVYAGDICLDRNTRRVTRAGADLGLTRKEFELLDHLIRHRRMVQSKEQLLDAVWGSTDYSPNVVEVAMSGLRRKLESHGERVVLTVRGVGYLYQPAVDEVPQLSGLMARRRKLLEERDQLIARRDRMIGGLRRGDGPDRPR